MKFIVETRNRLIATIGYGMSEILLVFCFADAETDLAAFKQSESR